MKTAIAVVNVVVKYNNTQAVVDRVSFSIPAGEIVMIIGPNGSGKTSLLRAIAGLLPFHGKISFFGKDLATGTTKIGYVPQRFEFDHTIPITVQEFLALSSPQCFSGNCIHEGMYQQIGVRELFKQPLRELSGGQLQRVLIARALLENPPILLLDEPASGIDVEGQQKIHLVLKDIQKKQKTTIVMISHEVDMVNYLADQVLCLNRKLVCQGKPQDVLNADTLKELYGEHTTIYHHNHD